MKNEEKIRQMTDEEDEELAELLQLRDDSIRDSVSVIEKWSKEHPIITNSKKFEEVFGVSLENTFILPSEVCNWLRKPYKEPEHEDENEST